MFEFATRRKGGRCGWKSALRTWVPCTVDTRLLQPSISVIGTHIFTVNISQKITRLHNKHPIGFTGCKPFRTCVLDNKCCMVVLMVKVIQYNHHFRSNLSFQFRIFLLHFKPFLSQFYLSFIVFYKWLQGMQHLHINNFLKHDFFKLVHTIPLLQTHNHGWLMPSQIPHAGQVNESCYNLPSLHARSGHQIEHNMWWLLTVLVNKSLIQMSSKNGLHTSLSVNLKLACWLPPVKHKKISAGTK